MCHAIVVTMETACLYLLRVWYSVHLVNDRQVALTTIRQEDLICFCSAFLLNVGQTQSEPEHHFKIVVQTWSDLEPLGIYSLICVCACLGVYWSSVIVYPPTLFLATTSYVVFGVIHPPTPHPPP